MSPRKDPIKDRDRSHQIPENQILNALSHLHKMIANLQDNLTCQATQIQEIRTCLLPQGGSSGEDVMYRRLLERQAAQVENLRLEGKRRQATETPNETCDLRNHLSCPTHRVRAHEE